MVYIYIWLALFFAATIINAVVYFTTRPNNNTTIDLALRIIVFGMWPYIILLLIANIIVENNLNEVKLALKFFCGQNWND